MSAALSILKTIASDGVILITFEFLFLGLFVYALRIRWVIKRRTGAIAIITRGEESWQKLYIAFGIASLVILQLVNLSEFGRGYKVIISIIDLVCLVYLTFYNAWFRDKIIAIISKSKDMKEGH